jgi:hypothetical protein
MRDIYLFTTSMEMSVEIYRQSMNMRFELIVLIMIKDAILDVGPAHSLIP